MVYLEEQRLAREAMRDALAEREGVDRCPDCSALVLIRVREEINDPEIIRGECRCLCGLVWEVELVA